MGKTPNREAAKAGTGHAQRNSGGAPEKSKPIALNQVPLVSSRGEVITLEHPRQLENEADHLSGIKAAQKSKT